MFPYEIYQIYNDWNLAFGQWEFQNEKLQYMYLENS